MTTGLELALGRIEQIRSQCTVARPPVAARTTDVAGPPGSASSGTSFDDVLARATQSSGSSSSLSWDGGRALGELPPGTPYADLFVQAAARTGVPVRLLAAVAQVESNFNPTAVSSAGAQGLMQFMPGTAEGMGLADPFDPAQAIDAGARLLAGHREAFGSWELALAAYNAGSGSVRKYGGIPPFAQTQAYVPKILGLAFGEPS